MSAHPTPWLLDTSDGKRRILATNAETGIQYALLFDDNLGFHAPDNSTLERIVQCVNAHDDLVSLLQRYVDLDVTCDGMKSGRVLQDSNLHRSARAAIAKATSNTDSASGSPASQGQGQVNKETP